MESQAMPDKKKVLLIVISIAFAAFMSKLDIYIVNVSLPAISSYFNVSTSIVSWVVLSFMLLTTSTLLLFGKLGDRFGIRRIFILGYIVFVGGSSLCGIAPNMAMLILGRCIQGIGGAMFVTCAFSAISRYLPRNKTGWAFGITATASSFGMLVGAPVGGFLTGLYSWHWVFLVNIPVGIIAIIVAYLVLPADNKEKQSNDQFDIFGAIISTIAIFLLIFALNCGHEFGWLSPIIIVSFIGFTVIFLWFLTYEKKIKDPLLDIKLFQNAEFLFPNLSAFFAFMLLSGNSFLIPFYLELTQGIKTTDIGMILMVYSLLFMVTGPLAGKLSDKLNPSVICSAGLLLATVSCFVFATLLNTPAIWPTILHLMLLGISFGLFISPNNKRVMLAAPKGEQGVASGMFQMMTGLGMTIGVSVFETIFQHYTTGGALSAGHISGISKDILFAGFRAVYITGGLISLIALIINLKGKSVSIEEDEEPSVEFTGMA